MMSRKRYMREQIIGYLRELEVLMSQSMKTSEVCPDDAKTAGSSSDEAR